MSIPQTHQISIQNACKLSKPSRHALSHGHQFSQRSNQLLLSPVQLKTCSNYSPRYPATEVFSSIAGTSWTLSDTGMPEQFVGKLMQQQMSKQSTASITILKASSAKRQPASFTLQTFSLLLLGIVSLPLMSMIRAANMGVSGMSAAVQAGAMLLPSVAIPSPPSPLAWFILSILWICAASLPMLCQVLLPLASVLRCTTSMLFSNAVQGFLQLWQYMFYTQQSTHIFQLPEATPIRSLYIHPQLPVALLGLYCASWVLQPVFAVIAKRVGKASSIQSQYPQTFNGGQPLLKSEEFWWCFARVSLMLITMCIAYQYQSLACQASAGLLACSMQLVGICIKQVA